jgi:hypothetical protein
MACGVRVVLDDSCGNDMSFAEVLVGDHLEEETLPPGADMLTCAKIEPNDAAVVFVRGGSWIWGPVDVDCDPPGGALVTLTFHCLENG